MFEDALARYVLNKDYHEFKDITTGIDKQYMLNYIENEIKGIEREEQEERAGFDNMSYDEVASQRHRLSGLRDKYTTLIQLRTCLHQDV